MLEILQTLFSGHGVDVVLDGFEIVKSGNFKSGTMLIIMALQFQLVAVCK